MVKGGVVQRRAEELEHSLRSFNDAVLAATSELRCTGGVELSDGLTKPWTLVQLSDSPLPRQGWKLHVTACIVCAPEVLEASLPILLSHRVTFKVAGTIVVLDGMNQGAGGLSQIGKFITVYPNNDDHAVQIAFELHHALQARDLCGPRIPSDRQLTAESLVYYRYGAFGNDVLRTAIGQLVPALLAESGEWVPDSRGLSYAPPDCVTDPFVASNLCEPVEEQPTLIAQRYFPLFTMHWSPRGAVYLAVDIVAARTCVLKQAGRGAVMDLDGRDARDRLRDEAQLLARLSSNEHVPSVLDIVSDHEALYLALSDVGRETLEARVVSTICGEEMLSLERALAWGCDLAALLGSVHETGFVYGDLKSSNILVADNGQLSLIDFEGSCSLTADTPHRRGTRGYTPPERESSRTGRITDDIFGLGAVLYFMTTGAEPSVSAHPVDLMRNPPTAVNLRTPDELAETIGKCLARDPANRYQSTAELLRDLKRIGKVASREEPDYGLAPYQDPLPAWNQHADGIARNLVAMAARSRHGHSMAWESKHSTAAGWQSRDISAGNAGTLLALAELSAANGGMYRDVLIEAAHCLAASPEPRGRAGAGLYAGEAGVGAALLRAGQVLGDEELVEAAATRSRWIAKVDYSSPDLFTGAAGRLRFHLLVWDATTEPEHRRAAVEAGDWLLSHANGYAGKGRWWDMPSGFDSLSGRACLGYAHGAAGIGDVLLDLFEASEDGRFLTMAAGASNWLADQAITTDRFPEALDWPDFQGGPATPAFWCRGATGIGRFFLHAAEHGLPNAATMAQLAGISAARRARWSSPTQCHGLAGNIEFLIDLYQSTHDRVHLIEAYSLASILYNWAVTREDVLLWPAEDGVVFSPDYLVGYAGVAICLLRLGDPDRRPTLLSRAGFRFGGASSLSEDSLLPGTSLKEGVCSKHTT